MAEFQEKDRLFAEESANIALRIKTLLGPRSYLKEYQHINTDEKRRWRSVTLDVNGSSIFILHNVSSLPEHIEFPAYSISSNAAGYEDDLERRTTPYGIVDNFFIGADGRTYVVSEKLFFNDKGQSIKFGFIKVRPRHPTSEQDILNKRTLKQVDFVPKEGEDWFLPLEPGDYEKAGALIRQIEQGEFVEIDLSSGRVINKK